MAEADWFVDFCWADLVCVLEDWIFVLDVNCTILSRVCWFSCYSKLPRRLEYVIQPSKWRCQTFLGKFERWAQISGIMMDCGL